MPPVHSREAQQNFYNQLGNRDYDCFQASDEEYLKLKIAYTKFGPPTDPEVLNNINDEFTVDRIYKKDQIAKIHEILAAIKSRAYNEDPNVVLISFLFNCCEPAQRKKLKKTSKKDEKKENDSKPEPEKVDISCFPVYRVRKCSGSPTGKNCCVYIDNDSRIYETWSDYLKTNKIPKARMCVPKDGKYKADENNQVLLTELLSPACQLKENLKRGADVTTTVASVVSGGIAVGAMVPAITVTPAVLAGALITAAGVGVYSMIRSSVVLHDRRTHSQTISLSNTEARNCYLNIVTGALSVIATGATKAASVALNRGVIVSETAATALLSVNAVNLTVNGCNAANSMASIINDIVKKKSPSALDIMHLTTTFLFFGNAVINFQSARVIYKQTQSNPFADILQTQKNGLWQKAKRLFFDADVTSSENNSPVKQVNNSEDFCLSVVGPMVPEREISAWPMSTQSVINTFVDWQPTLQLSIMLVKNRDNVRAVIHIILSRFEFGIQEKLVQLTKWLIGSIIQDAQKELSRIFPGSEIVVVLLNYVINYLTLKVTELEIEYQQKRAAAMADLQMDAVQYEVVCSGFRDNWQRMAYFFKICVLKMFCARGNVDELICREIVRFFWDWLRDQTFKFIAKREQRQSTRNNRKQTVCTVCEGHYYQ